MESENPNDDNEVATLEGEREFFYGETGWYAEGIEDPRVLARELDADEEANGLTSEAFFELLKVLTQDTEGLIPIPVQAGNRAVGTSYREQ